MSGWTEGQGRYSESEYAPDLTLDTIPLGMTVRSVPKSYPANPTMWEANLHVEILMG